MTESEVQELTRNGLFQNKPVAGKIEETHISWVILTGKYVFKIKKPVKLSFLDFSTLMLRKKNCERELQLNSRFTTIYQKVVTIRHNKGKWRVGNGNGKIVDYAVQMRRLMASKKMDNVLRNKRVKETDIAALAKVIASFHQKALRINTPFNLTTARNTFNDIADIIDFVNQQFTKQFGIIISKSIVWSDSFLAKHAKRFQERIDEGFKRDVHGDLHSGNIFLYKQPVLFDCIEFNDQYRQIDVLYELAFLCMDLEAFKQRTLAKKLVLEYTQFFNSIQKKEDEKIFLYYKCLRANIRAKVHAMQVLHSARNDIAREHISELKKYILMMETYMDSA